MSPTAAPSPFESAWQTLRASLEWAHEFGLIFIFGSGGPSKEALFTRADDLMRSQARPFQRLQAQSADDLLHKLLPILAEPASLHVAANIPLWLNLDAHPNDAQWNTARTQFLSRLNERRARLVRENSRSVVLVLPQGWTKQAAQAAPDLWTIRQPGLYLPAGPPADGNSSSQQSQNSVGEASVLTVSGPKGRPRELPAPVRRWLQASETGELDVMTVWDGTQAADAALETGETALALRIAHQTSQTARSAITNQGTTPERLRDLSVSMNKLGDVARALGQLQEAKTAYAEGETLSRQLLADFGATPERLRDLSISMNNLGEVARALGQLQEAKTAYAEGGTLSRQLLADFGATPERLRDLSVSMERLGDVAQALGQLQEAKTAYAEGEKISLLLIEQFGESVLALETLAYHSARLAQLADPQLETTQKQQAYARHLYERLSLAMPHEQRYKNMLQELGGN